MNLRNEKDYGMIPLVSSYSRRKFLQAMIGAGISPMLGCGSERLSSSEKESFQNKVSIIDAHTHFWDIRRPEGIPWPPKTDSLLYKTILPEDMQAFAEPLGVSGVIMIEAAYRNRVEENQWGLNLAKAKPYVVGFVGSLDVFEQDFESTLERFSDDTVFSGIRLKSDQIASVLESSIAIANLKKLAEKGLMVDLLARSLTHIESLAAGFPELRLVVHHMPLSNSPVTTTSELGKLAIHDNIFLKVSNVVSFTANQLSEVKPTLDSLWDVFGSNKLLFGSNYPVSDHKAPYEQILNLMKEYVNKLDEDSREKFFGRNAESVYVKRDT
ncbi:amidohydrolase family protein [Planctomycetota bacterium]